MRAPSSRCPPILWALGLSLLVAGTALPDAGHADDARDHLSANEIIRSLAPYDYLPEHSGAARAIELALTFALGSATLTPDAMARLDALGEALDDPALDGTRLLIAGHTDASGPAAVNLALSTRRAAAAKAYLVRVHGIDPARLETEGWGEMRLKDPLSPRSGVNRRVEVTVIDADAPGPASPAAEKPDDAGDWVDPARIDAIAASLLAGIADSGAAPRTLALLPFARSLPIDRARAEAANDTLLASLRARVRPGVLVADPNEADLLIVGTLRLLGPELSLRYKAVSATGTVEAVTDALRIPMTPALAGPGRLVTLDEAIAAAAATFRDQAHDMAVLTLGGLRFQDTGVQTPFGRYVENGLASALRQAFADVLSERKLTIEPARIPALAFGAMDGTDVGPDALAPEAREPRPGAYVLAGEYWDFHDHVDTRIWLRDAHGRQVGWDGRIQKAGLGPSIRVRPRGDFGTWRENDGLGPIRLTLTSDRYADPVYRIGETMNLLVEADRDVWLYCFYRQVDDQVFLILPNPYHPNPRVAGNRAQTIPGTSLPFDFVLRAPPGVELIKCFAYDRDVSADLPLALRQDALRPLPSPLARDIPGLMRAVPAAGRTEASLVVTVAP